MELLCLKHAVVESEKVHKTVKKVANLLGNWGNQVCSLTNSKQEDKKLGKHYETRRNSKSLESVVKTEWKKVPSEVPVLWSAKWL